MEDIQRSVVVHVKPSLSELASVIVSLGRRDRETVLRMVGRCMDKPGRWEWIEDESEPEGGG